MSINTIRLLDKTIGQLVCWIFTVIRWSYKFIIPYKKVISPQKVLIIKLAEMGSTVLAYPSITELKRQNPDIEIYFLVFDHNKEILKYLSFLKKENIVCIKTNTIKELVLTGIKAMYRMRKESIDTVIDFDFFSRFSTAFSYMICRGNRIGFYRFAGEGLGRGNLLTHRVIYSHHIHTANAFFALVKTLINNNKEAIYYREKIDSKASELPLLKISHQQQIQLYQKLELNLNRQDVRSKLILINPNSSEFIPLRKWPLEHYGQLCKDLFILFPNATILITGTEGEIEDGRMLEGFVKNEKCINIMGKTSFDELMTLYSIANLLVSNDSGPAHFASLFRLPSVVLFGPETPDLYSPLGGKAKCLYSQFSCSPCVSVYNGKKSLCNNNKCLKAISVKEVFNAASNLVN
jgi:ADP-heptose:LPS heptosyltransferase